MEPNQIIDQNVGLLSALADAGDVDESWEIQAVIDRLYIQEEPDTDGPDE